MPDTPENMEICKKFCGPCLSFEPNKLNESPSMPFFCVRCSFYYGEEDILVNVVTEAMEALVVFLGKMNAIDGVNRTINIDCLKNSN